MDPNSPKTPPENLQEVEALPSVRTGGPEPGRAHRWPTAAPRLSVVHLLVWTAFSALFLAAVRKLNPVEPGGWGLILAAASALGYGAAWTGLSVWFMRLMRGTTWPVEPGHWLLVAMAVRLGLDLALRLWLAQWLRSTETVLDAVTVCCFVLPLLSRSLPVVWHFCFVLALTLYAWPLIVAVVDGWMLVPAWVWTTVAAAARWHAIALAAIVAIFAAIDLPEWRQRGWLHWSGIAVCFWLAAVSYFAR